MHCFFRNASAAFIGVTATLYFLIGIAILAASIYALTGFLKDLVPPLVSGSGIAGGVIIALIACTGYAGICCSQRGKCWLSVFAVFDFLVLVATIAITYFMFNSTSTIQALSTSDFSDAYTTTDQIISNTIRSGYSATFLACEANVTHFDAPLGPDGIQHYTMQCRDINYKGLADSLSDNCLNDHNVTFAPWKTCYNSTWWPVQPDTVLSGPKPMQVDDGMLYPDNPKADTNGKGVFCQCSEVFSDWMNRYLTTAQWVAVGVDIFFGLVFLSCCYILCCKPDTFGDEQGNRGLEFSGMSQGYTAKP